MTDEGVASTPSRRDMSLSTPDVSVHRPPSPPPPSGPSHESFTSLPPPSSPDDSPSNSSVDDGSGHGTLLVQPPTAPVPQTTASEHDPHRAEVALSYRLAAYSTAAALVPLLFMWALGYKVCQYIAMLHGPIAMLSANMCWCSGLFRQPTWWEGLIPWVVALSMILAYVNTILDAAPIRSKVLGGISIFCLKMRSAATVPPE